MLDLFHTHAAAQRLSALSEAAVTVLGELRELRMRGLAHAVFELLMHNPDATAVRIAITQQELPLLVPAVGGNRVLHCGVTLEPCGKLIDVPADIVPASVIGEGEFRAERAELRDLLALYDERRENAVLQLCERMDPCFLQVLHTATTNVLT